jgi:hypothetical protein
MASAPVWQVKSSTPMGKVGPLPTLPLGDQCSVWTHHEGWRPAHFSTKQRHPEDQPGRRQGIIETRTSSRRVLVSFAIFTIF